MILHSSHKLYLMYIVEVSEGWSEACSRSTESRQTSAWREWHVLPPQLYILPHYPVTTRLDSCPTVTKITMCYFGNTRHLPVIAVLTLPQIPRKGKQSALIYLKHIKRGVVSRIKWKSCRESYALINMELECDPNREGKTATMQTGVVSNCRACKHIKGRRANDT